MRRVVYSVGMSLDGYIAGPAREFDWIVIDPDVDSEETFCRFDTFLMGRRTFELVTGRGGGMGKGTRTLVFSRTLRPADHPKVTVVADNPDQIVRDLRAPDVQHGQGDLVVRRRRTVPHAPRRPPS